MYQVLVPKSVIKEIKKLGKPVVQKVKIAIEDIAENPYLGEPLKGDLADIRKWVIKDRGIQYRIAYEIYEDRVEVKIIRVGTRENFYEELKRML
jgi:mRNA interferase RelE/StbE